jgi:hypothetical protein
MRKIRKMALKFKMRLGEVKLVKSLILGIRGIKMKMKKIMRVMKWLN